MGTPPGGGRQPDPGKATPQGDDMSGNQTPETQGLSETELRGMKVGELRERAREEGVDAPSNLRKEELVYAISEAQREAGDGAGQPEAVDAGDTVPDGGRIRTGGQ